MFSNWRVSLSCDNLIKSAYRNDIAWEVLQALHSLHERLQEALSTLCARGRLLLCTESGGMCIAAFR